VVGRGNHGTNLALAVARSGLLQLVACDDPDASATQRVARTTSGVRTYTSLQSLLQANNIVIDLPPHQMIVSCPYRTART
jgi:predicted dehydrogenase